MLSPRITTASADRKRSSASTAFSACRFAWMSASAATRIAATTAVTSAECRLRGAAKPRPCTDDVERRTAGTGELARGGNELPCADRGDRLGQLGFEGRQLRPLERVRDDRIGSLEEVVDDLDLLRPGAEAGERVDEPLQAVVGLDDLLRAPLGQRVRLVVEHERARSLALEHVEPPVQEDAVVLEREGPLRPRSGEPGDPTGELGLAVGARRIPRSGRAPRRSRPGTRSARARRPAARRGEIDELEQPVHGVADLGRGEPGAAGQRAARIGRAHARRRARRSSGRSSARRARAR